MTYNPNDYWQVRLSRRFNLSGVGHFVFNEHYNKWLYKAKKRTLEKILLLHGIVINDKTICDMGCGTGYFVDFFHERGVKDIVGVDISTTSIVSLNKKYPQYLFIRRDISSYLLVSVINRQFDILNAFDVLYHIIDDKSLRTAISNMSHLTKEGGFIFISDLLGKNNIDAAEHVKFRSKEMYEKLFEENSFEIMDIYPLYYFLNRPIFAKIGSFGLSIDNLCAPLYYYLDSFFLTSKKSNLNVIIAKKVKP
jgi:2-polyprenyl-3-methyl-5-hydroxy-6-metoxy-1,4-benzoquinol methylase